MPVRQPRPGQSHNTYRWWRARSGDANMLPVDMCFMTAFLERSLAISIKLKISFDPDIPLWETVPEKQMHRWVRVRA